MAASLKKRLIIAAHHLRGIFAWYIPGMQVRRTGRAYLCTYTWREYPPTLGPTTPGRSKKKYKNHLRVDLNEEYFLVFFRYFSEISVFSCRKKIKGKNQETPNFRKNTEKINKKQPSLRPTDPNDRPKSRTRSP